VLSVIKGVDKAVAAAAIQTYHLLEETAGSESESTSQLAGSPRRGGLNGIDGK
jgi:hypothetical protein